MNQTEVRVWSFEIDIDPLVQFGIFGAFSNVNGGIKTCRPLGNRAV